MFIIFGFFGFMYFFTQTFIVPTHLIHCKLDDAIPFCEIFIIPYVSWYLYILLPLLYLCFKSKRDFYAMCIQLFMGMFITMVTFAVYPTYIDFRPTEFEQNNIFTWIIQNLIYANDQPTNVCPSLHCYESVAICTTMIKSEPLQNRRKTNIFFIISAILICASTVFIKQHSIIDVVFGVALIIPAHLLTYKIVMPALDKKKNPLY